MPATVHNVAFEGGEVVSTIGFDFDAVAAHLDGDQSGDEAEEKAIRLETIKRLLAFLARGRKDARKVGKRVHLLGYLCGVSEAKNQRQLARVLGVTPGAVSQKLNLLRREFRTLARDL